MVKYAVVIDPLGCEEVDSVHDTEDAAMRRVDEINPSFDATVEEFIDDSDEFEAVETDELPF